MPAPRGTALPGHLIDAILRLADLPIDSRVAFRLPPRRIGGPLAPWGAGHLPPRWVCAWLDWRAGDRARQYADCERRLRQSGSEVLARLGATLVLERRQILQYSYCPRGDPGLPDERGNVRVHGGRLEVWLIWCPATAELRLRFSGILERDGIREAEYDWCTGALASTTLWPLRD